MDDSALIAAVRGAFADVRMQPTADIVIIRGRALRRRRRLPAYAAAAIAVAAGCAAVAFEQPLAPPTGPSRTHPTISTGDGTLAAWTVHESPTGEVQVTVYQMRDVAGLQARLRDDGVPAVVSSSLALPAGCTNWKDGNYSMGDVITDATLSGLPAADGTEFAIQPADIPQGVLLWIGLAQSGAPAGSAGPSGPMATGYMADVPSCANG